MAIRGLRQGRGDGAALERLPHGRPEELLGGNDLVEVAVQADGGEDLTGLLAHTGRDQMKRRPRLAHLIQGFWNPDEGAVNGPGRRRVSIRSDGKDPVEVTQDHPNALSRR
jgi:hypothetical protein